MDDDYGILALSHTLTHAMRLFFFWFSVIVFYSFQLKFYTFSH